MAEEGKARQSTTMKDEEWEVLDKKASRTIWLCMASLVDLNISKEKIIEGVMSALAKIYEKPSASNKVFLVKRLFNMNMSEGGAIVDHLNEFNTITSQLSSVKVKFDDEVRDILILCSLLESWNGLVMAISNYVSGSNTLKFDDVFGVVISKEM